MKLKVKEIGAYHLSDRLGFPVTVDSVAEFEDVETFKKLPVTARASVFVDGNLLKMTFLEIAQTFDIYEDENEDY